MHFRPIVTDGLMAVFALIVLAASLAREFALPTHFV